MHSARGRVTLLIVTPFIFILSALFALSIALLTVSLQTKRAAQADPVDSLRYE